MATFYVLPSRRQLGQRIGEMLAALFPGTHNTSRDWPELAESLAGLVEGQGEAFIVYREDLDERLGVRDALMQHFGADWDDEIVEIPVQVSWATGKARQAA